MTKILIIFLSIFIIPPYNSQSQDIPKLNQEIINYVNSVLGKKVDRGECWDLAYQVLTRNNAAWDGKYKYGNLVNYEKEVVFPGDIIQFKNVKLKYLKSNLKYTETMAHHTAIIYEVISPGAYKIAHQNTGEFGRKVGISEFHIKDMNSGKIKVYRPVYK